MKQTILSEEEKQKLIALGKGEELVYDQTKTFIDLFCKQVAMSPNSIAVVFKDKKYTYSEIDRLSTLLALHLRNQGVTQETVVGVMIDRSEWMVIYPLAIMKAGGAYMPLDYNLPAERLYFMVEKADVSLILSDEKDRLKTAIPEFKGNVITTTDVLALPNTNEELLYRPSAHNMYVVLYTSGSTGKPKGCVLEHHSLLNFCYWYIKDFEVTSNDRGLAYANFGFDVHMMDIFPMLMCGGSIYIIPSDMRLDIAAVNSYIEDSHITIAFLTTQIGIQFVSMFKNKSLRLLSVAGEKLPPINKPSYRLFNGYGPTECTIYATFYEFQKDNDNEYIGRPLANYQLYVLDSKLNMVPRGVAGELCISGSGVGRCYLNNPEQTKEMFTTLDGKRIYRTGDLVRWAENDNLQFLGRIDNQVKLRGFRIELGEIESAISKYKGIQNSVVVVKEIGSVQHLCGYYTSLDAIDQGKLRSFLSETLTDYMVPTALVQLSSMPLTPNGKVDRKALPMPEIKAEEIASPETEFEHSLFDIVSKLLGTTSFGVTTNLISMGLTSIGAIKLSIYIQRELGLNLPTKDILQKPTIRTWSGVIGAEEEVLAFYEKRDYYPLTENQLAVYIDWEQNRNSLQYNIPMAFKLTGANPAILKESLENVLKAHTYLKTRFGIRKGELMQLSCENALVDILFKTLETEPNEEFFQSRVRPFNLLEENLYRIEVYTSAKHTYLFIDIHHILYDGGSVNILIHDLQKCYNGIEIKPELFTAFDYSLYYADWKTSEAYKESELYFDGLVSGAEPVQYPISGESKMLCGSGELSTSMPLGLVKELCRKVGVTENSFFTTILTQVLHRITREDNLLITTISNGRSLPKLSESVGMFVQTLPVVSHTNHQSIEESLVGMHKQLLETVSRDKYPFTSLVERHGVKPNILIAYQGEVADEKFYLEGHEVINIPLQLTTANIPLSLNIIPNEKAYNFLFGYDTSLYNRLDIERLGQTLKSFITAVTTLPLDNKIANIPIVSSKDKETLIALGKGEELVYNQTETFIDLFRKQVALHPNSTAVVDEASSLTYAELDRQSDLLAHVLVDNGVAIDTFVAVMLDRQKEFLVSVLAVFKAGGAYIPLDSDYPNERLLYMIEDSQAKVLITTKELLEEKRKEGNFRAEHILFVDKFDFSATCSAINNSSPEYLAYMIYTSGSTGKPKGVMIEHKGLTALIAWLTSMEGLKHGDKCVEHPSFSFDASLFDLYPPLTVGAEVHILSSSLRHDMDGIYNYLKQHTISGATFSTQLGMELLNQYDLPLRYMVMGGEKLNPTRPTSVKVINGYGPTEFTVCSSYHIVEQGRKYNNIPIGGPAPNTISAIVDVAGNLTPLGVAGELCLIGRQTARGYWNRPELTAQKFMDCPFIEGEKMYRTGDLARWNKDGELEYIGRIDTQVKLRGFRIELGEIESAMSKYKGIQNSVVEVKEIGSVQHLCGYYTSLEAIDQGKLRSFLSETLTDYMVPTALVQLSSMPLTPNGKVNRKALPMPDIYIELENVQPESELEVKMFDIARELLPDVEFGVTDDLLSLGMTSLLTMRFVARLRAINLTIRITAVMRDRNIRAILKGNIRLFWIYSDYDASKPTLIFVHGIVPYGAMQPKFEQWSESFNIFIIEPLDSHYQVLFNDADLEDVIWMYSTLLEQHLPKDAFVFGFMGFSWGGEMAYYLAQRWHETRGELPAVIMGDTFLNNPVVDRPLTVADIDPKIIENSKNLVSAEELVFKFNCVHNMERTKKSTEPYSGHVLFLNAIKNGLTLKKQENLSLLCELASDLEIVDFPDSLHDELFVNQSFNTIYQELLLNIIIKQ